MSTPPVCNYEGSDYQASFWDRGGREYEDRTEAIALRRLLPGGGQLMLELGAGAGRNTRRYAGYERVVLLDYSSTQLEQARQRLGDSSKYIYVAADIYRLPFVEGLFDGATMIRTLHHMADAPRALSQVRAALRPGAVFILEFASKLNLKAILRYWLGRQRWSPFTPEPVEFAALNFDFHPRTVFGWLGAAGFQRQRTLTLSHFRLGLLKRLVPTALLVWLDAAAQWTGAWWQLTPSVFVRSQAVGRPEALPGGFPARPAALFKCPDCAQSPLEEREFGLQCRCGKRWGLRNGIYDFREPLSEGSDPPRII